MQSLDAGFVRILIGSQQQADTALGAHGLLGRGQRQLAFDRDGKHHAGEQHGIADR